MIKNSKNSFIEQARRLKIKTLEQQMKSAAVLGTGLSPWEAEVLVQSIEDIYFADALMKPLQSGQVRYQCVAAGEGAGKPLENCQLVSAVLTLFHSDDKGDFTSTSSVHTSAELRRRRLSRLAEEAEEYGGYLTQEDLAELLMCDVRTIRRDIRNLKALGIVIPTRGQKEDIGPGLTHRTISVRLWLEGNEPVVVARKIKHSIRAVENYITKFQRVCYLKQKAFDKYQIAMTVGISVFATETFLDLVNEFKNHGLFKQRIGEINVVGAQYYQAQDEKKVSMLSRDCTRHNWSAP